MDRNVTPPQDIGGGEQNSDYYRDGSKNIMRIINIQVALILVLSILLAVVITNKENQDRYFAEMTEGRKMQMLGLTYPNVGRAALATWVSTAVTQIMTFGFNDVNQRLDEARFSFTEAGWESFVKAVVESKFVASVVEAQQIITSVLMSPPEIKQEGLEKGIYTWHFSTKLLITFRAGGVKRTEVKTVYVVIEKVPTSENPNGVGIGKWMIY